MTAEDIFRIMSYDPITLNWKDMEDKLRLTVQGDMEGHPVVLHIYDSDLTPAHPGDMINNPFDHEVGIVQYISGVMHDHGLLPPFRRKSEQGADTQTQTATWACKYHGSEQLRKNNFGNGFQCSYREEATGWNAPEWANSKTPKDYQGKKYWWCNQKEN